MQSPQSTILRAGVAAAVTVAAVLLGLVLRPAPSALPDTRVGDAELAELAREALGPQHHAVAVASISPEGVQTAAIGAELDDRFELGSIGKGMTGLLFADAIERGEVGADTPVGEILDLGDAPVAQVTLSELATHRSGLPVQPSGMKQYLNNLWATLSGANPYAGDQKELIDGLRATAVDTAPQTYSNLGFELLGAALAHAAGKPYSQLVFERVITPIGMDDAVIPKRESELTSKDLIGQDLAGRSADPWIGEAMEPAAGLRADIEDMAILAQALLEGTAPGIDALQPKAEFNESEIGWAWLTTESDSGRDVIWHNGGTGGFASFIGIDPQAGTGVVVLAASTATVDDAGWTLLDKIGER